MSGGFEAGLEANPQVKIVLIAIEQSELIDKDGSEGKPTGSGQATGGHRPVPIKDAFELFVEVFDSQGAGFVQDAAHFNAGVGMRIGMAFSHSRS